MLLSVLAVEAAAAPMGWPEACVKIAGYACEAFAAYAFFKYVIS